MRENRELKHMNLKERKKTLKDERGVSPVIGVILMVAITVILAAIIGTFVLGLGKNVQQNASAGVTAANGDTVTLNSLGPGTVGIRCSNSDDVTADSGETEDVGTSITCDDSDSVVAYGDDVSTAVVHEFDN